MEVDDEPVTRRECASLHSHLTEGLGRIENKLDTLNGSVAENTKFRVQSKAIYGAVAFGWVSLLIPLVAVAIAVLR